MTGEVAKRVMRSIFAPLALMLAASSLTAFGISFLDKITTCTRSLFVAMVDLCS